MHHVYTRRLVILLVSFFVLLAILFGPLVVALRSQGPASSASAIGNEAASANPDRVTLPDGATAFDNLCASCHQAQKMADKVKGSLDPDATSRAQLEKLVGPPAHGGASPAEALAIVIHLRTLAGLSAEYQPGVPTPAAAATAEAAQPTPTPVPLAEVKPDASEAVFKQHCAKCHQAQKFAVGLRTTADPDAASRQAIQYLSGPPPHRNVPAESIAPAIDHVRQLAGLPPLPQ
jgi:cytochrome c5